MQCLKIYVIKRHYHSLISGLNHIRGTFNPNKILAESSYSPFSPLERPNFCCRNKNAWQKKWPLQHFRPTSSSENNAVSITILIAFWHAKSLCDFYIMLIILINDVIIFIVCYTIIYSIVCYPFPYSIFHMFVI